MSRKRPVHSNHLEPTQPKSCAPSTQAVSWIEVGSESAELQLFGSPHSSSTEILVAAGVRVKFGWLFERRPE